MSLSISMPGRNPKMERRHRSLLAGVEKQCLLWLANRLPGWVQPDHLTLLASASTFMGGVSYAGALVETRLHLVIRRARHPLGAGEGAGDPVVRFRPSFPLRELRG